MSEGIWMKKSLVAAVAAGTLVLTACNDEGTTTKTVTETVATNYQSINNPTGSITGLVTDTNGYPIEGATVYLGNQTAVTNAGGQYYFSEVAVTQTVKNDSDEYAQALALTIVPPTGYLGATVTVTPQAQIFNGSETSADDANEVSNPVTTFIDGFNASAGTAVLPATTASVQGVLRHSISGEALAGVRVSMDLESSSIGVDQEQEQDGVKTSYATASITATTSSSGAFSFTGVPADAVLRLAAEGYTVAKTVDTSDEDTLVSLGSVMATPVLSNDDISPWVSSVSEVITQSAARGMLNDDVTTTLTVNFSETISSGLVDANSVIVRDVTGGAYLAKTVAVSGSTLTITLAAALEEDHEIDVLLLKADFKDTAGNALGIVDGSSNPSDIGYDYNTSASTGTEYVRLELKQFFEANQDALAVETFTQEQSDETGIDTHARIQEENKVFLDVNDASGGIQQLNSAADDDSVGGADSAERLSALLAQIAGTIGSAGSTAVEVDTTLVHFTPTNASTYRIEVLDSTGDSKWNGLAAKELKGLGELDNGVDPDYGVVTPDGNAQVEILLDGVVPGDQVVVTPVDDFGYDGTPTTLPLTDNVAPTTVLQSSYGIGDDDNGGVTSLLYGDGGEQSAEESVQPGTPYYDLTPRLLGEVDGTATGPEDDVDYVRTFKRLYSYNAVNPVGSSNTTEIQGEEFIDPDSNIYDKSALTGYLAGEDFNRTLGVAFSEDLNTTMDGTPVFTSVSGAIEPSNFVVSNNVSIDDNGTAVNVDLVNFDLSDIYNFALEQDGSVLDFTDSVSDTAGNIASAAADVNPSVVVRDLIPPMVVSARYEGRALIIEFDKAIDVSAIDTPASAMSLNGVNIDLSDSDNYEWDAGTLTLTVLRRDENEGDFNTLGYGVIDLPTVFDLGQYNDDNLGASVSSDTLRFKHAALDFSKIPNANGAAWADYDGLGLANEGYFEAPEFAVQNRVRTFTVTNGTPDITSGANPSIQISYTFTHEVDWSTIGDTGGTVGALDSDEIQAMFSLVNGTAGSSPNITADGNSVQITEDPDGQVVYTFTLTLDGDAQTGNGLDFVSTAIPSAYQQSGLGTTVNPNEITL